MNKILYIILISFIVSNCSFKPVVKHHGVPFLEKKQSQLIVNKSNKNDVIKIFGQPHTTSVNNQNEWIYIERVLVKGEYHKLGKHVLKQNNVLILDFNKYGILTNKKFLNKDDINQIKFSKRNTENELSQKNFIRSFLESIRQKMYSNKK